ncbi:MAG: DUF6587 family protein [Spongiibacteraceae bacterium]
MNETAQLVIVFGIVAVATTYALWRFVPGLKKQLAPKLATGLNRAGLVSEQKAAELSTRLSAASGCGSCDSCGACGPKDPNARKSPQRRAQ